MAAVEERSEAGPTSQRRHTRPFVVVLLVVAIAAAGVAAYRIHDDRATRWESHEEPWHSVSLSDDGETVTFTMSTTGSCDSFDRVEWEGDPAVDDELTATVYVETIVRRDGHPVYCTTAATFGVTYTVATPAGVRPDTVVVDGSDPGSCPGSEPVRQRLADPAASTPGC